MLPQGAFGLQNLHKVLKGKREQVVTKWTTVLPIVCLKTLRLAAAVFSYWRFVRRETSVKKEVLTPTDVSFTPRMEGVDSSNNTRGSKHEAA